MKYVFRVNASNSDIFKELIQLILNNMNTFSALNCLMYNSDKSNGGNSGNAR